MPHRRIAVYNGLFAVLALVMWPHPAMAQDSARCAQLELIPSPPQHGAQSPVDIQVEIPGSVPVANLVPYLGRLTASISHNLRLRLPEFAGSGNEGTVVIRVQLRKDGSLPKNGLSIACTSGIKDLDAAAQSVIQSTAPFEPLPETYGWSDLVLLFRFRIPYRFVPSHPSQRT